MKQVLIFPKGISPPFNNRIFDEFPSGERNSGFYGSGWWCALRDEFAKNGYELQTIDMKPVEDADLIIIMGHLFDEHYTFLGLDKVKAKKILFEVEFPVNAVESEGGYAPPETFERYDKVLTWNKDVVDNKKVFYIQRPNNWYNKQLSKIPFSQRKLVCMANSNKTSNVDGQLYSARRRIIEFLQEEAPTEFDLYGTHWDRSLVRWIRKDKYDPNGLWRQAEKFLGIDKFLYHILWEKDLSKCYKGFVLDYLQIAAKYKFIIVYENSTGYRGEVSNKIFDALQVGVIPVYLGAKDIEEIIPANCFIDKRKFEYEQLLSKMRNTTEREFNGYLVNAKRFLASQEGRKHFESDWSRQFVRECLT